MSAKQKNRPDDDSRKKLTRTQADVTTVQTAWELFLPTAQMPKPGHVVSWLARASVEQILTLIEEAAQRPDMRSPRYFVWDRIKAQASVSV